MSFCSQLSGMYIEQTDRRTDRQTTVISVLCPPYRGGGITNSQNALQAHHRQWLSRAILPQPGGGTILPCLPSGRNSMQGLWSTPLARSSAKTDRAWFSRLVRYICPQGPICRGGGWGFNPPNDFLTRRVSVDFSSWGSILTPVLVLHVSTCGASTLSAVGDPPPNVFFTNRTLFEADTLFVPKL